jgi:hypothetical protein
MLGSPPVIPDAAGAPWLGPPDGSARSACCLRMQNATLPARPGARRFGTTSRAGRRPPQAPTLHQRVVWICRAGLTGPCPRSWPRSPPTKSLVPFPASRGSSPTTGSAPPSRPERAGSGGAARGGRAPRPLGPGQRTGRVHRDRERQEERPTRGGQGDRCLPGPPRHPGDRQARPAGPQRRLRLEPDGGRGRVRGLRQPLRHPPDHPHSGGCGRARAGDDLGAYHRRDGCREGEGVRLGNPALRSGDAEAARRANAAQADRHAADVLPYIAAARSAGAASLAEVARALTARGIRTVEGGTILLASRSAAEGGRARRANTDGMASARRFRCESVQNKPPSTRFQAGAHSPLASCRVLRCRMVDDP